MSTVIGAVRFKDRSLMYFVYQNNRDMADRELFSTPDQALTAAEVSRPKIKITERMYENEEQVDVMPYFKAGNEGVYFRTRASKQDQVITGPVGAWEQQFPSM